MSARPDILRSEGGWVTWETVVTYPWLLTAFLTFVQLGYYEMGRLTTTHAAVCAARSASVVLADDPKSYDTPVGVGGGKRLAEITDAARMPLRTATPTRDPALRVSLDRSKYVQGDQVKVKVEFDFPCRVAVAKWIVCGTSGKLRMTEEAKMPYQGAGYAYP